MTLHVPDFAIVPLVSLIGMTSGMFDSGFKPTPVLARLITDVAGVLLVAAVVVVLVQMIREHRRGRR